MLTLTGTSQVSKASNLVKHAEGDQRAETNEPDRLLHNTVEKTAT